MFRFRQLKAEVALNNIGAIISYEHEWDVTRDCGSGLPMPGPLWARWFLGDAYFARPCGCIICDYSGSIDYLRWLTFLSSLREISIIQSRVGDELCECLRDLRNLRSISLHSTLVTDAGINRLSILQNLETLIVGETAVTQNGRKELNRRLPKCKIVDSVPVTLAAA
jgi:hypothetical protein